MYAAGYPGLRLATRAPALATLGRTAEARRDVYDGGGLLAVEREGLRIAAVTGALLDEVEQVLDGPPAGAPSEPDLTATSLPIRRPDEERTMSATRPNPLHRLAHRAATLLLGLLVAACASHDLRANPGWAEGRALAEVEFARGTAEPVLVCGTIAPGECSSMEQELYEQAFAGGYDERLNELETAAQEPR